MACTVYRGSQLNDRLALTSASHHSYSISPCNLTLFCTVQSSSENNLDSPQPVGTPSPILLPTSPLMTVHSATAVQPYREFHYFPPTTRLHPGVSKLPCWICFPKKKRSFMRDPDSTDPIPHTGSLSSPKLCSTPSPLFPSWTLIAHPHPLTPSCITLPGSSRIAKPCRCFYSP